MFCLALDLTKLIPLAVLVGVGAVTWLIVDLLWGRKRSAEQRLQQWSTVRGENGAATKSDDEANKVTDAVSTWLKTASQHLARPLQPKKQEDVSRLKQRLTHAGFRSSSAPTVFLSMRLISVAIGFLLGGGVVLLSVGLSPAVLIRLLAVVGVAFFVPDIVLWVLTRRRQKAIFLGLPDALDLMVVSVEAGLGLDQAMRKVASEMKKSYPVVAFEFGLANMQLQMGVSRVEMLRQLGQRNGEEDLQSLASVLIQANKFGTSIGQTLRVQSDSMRTRRRQIAEEKASKASVKLIFPLVLFIFPAIFVVLVGPAALTMIRNLFPAMTGSG
jgi:tight adherence protein C